MGPKYLNGPAYIIMNATPNSALLYALPSTVLIVEDEPLFQQRLEQVLLSVGLTPTALTVAASLSAAQTYLQHHKPELALVDLGLPDGHGTELIKQLRAQQPQLPIMVISAWSTDSIIVDALTAGATGYLLKEREDIEISLAIHNVLRGGAPIDPFIARHILALLPAQPAQPITLSENNEATLTPREQEILTFVANGLSNREIAEHLYISRYTVESHVKHIYRKLAVSSRIKAISEAREKGWLD